MQITDMPSSERVVLFADMLGFSDLIEKYPIDLDEMKAKSRPLSVENISYMFDGFPEFFDPKTFPLCRIPDKIKKPENRLSEIFVNFHKSIKWAIEMAKMQYPITAITFSDSVFIVTNYLFEAVQIAVDLVQGLMSQKVPLRVGIAYGSFEALTFKSDITIDGGDHASQFLGTAVVRAHLAESCGIKGIRILLHPSAMPLLKDKTHNPESQSVLSQPIHYLECAEKEQKNKADVHYEVDYWNFKVKRNAEGSWKGLQDMWKDAPENETVHYIATAEAIERMRMTHGEKPLKNLRRRTLPN